MSGIIRYIKIIQMYRDDKNMLEMMQVTRLLGLRLKLRLILEFEIWNDLKTCYT